MTRQSASPSASRPPGQDRGALSRHLRPGTPLGCGPSERARRLLAVQPLSCDPVEVDDRAQLAEDREHLALDAAVYHGGGGDLLAFEYPIDRAAHVACKCGDQVRQLWRELQLVVFEEPALCL